MTDVVFRSDMSVQLIDFMGGDLRVVQAARVSTQGHNEANTTGLVKFLMREGHHVPFEHSVFTFAVEAPIFVMRQLLKHRIASISETSGRYRELDGEFYVPSPDRPVVQVGKTGDYNFSKDVDMNEFAAFYIKEASENAWGDYRALIERGVAKEVARMVLPVNLYSQMYMTVNARSLMNVQNLRNEHHAQYEIQEVARKMEAVFAEKMPVTYEAFRDPA